MAVIHYLHTLHTFFIVLTVVRGQEDTPGWKTLHLVVPVPASGEYAGGVGLLPAVTMAVEDIDKRIDLLPGYKFKIMWYDTKCDSGVGIKGLYSQLYSPPTKIAIVGPVCSVVAEAVSKSAYLWNVVQVSSSAQSPALSNKTKFPNFLRVNSPEKLMNPAKVAIIKRYNWTRVATIHEPIPLFSEAIDDLHMRLIAENMTLISSHIIRDNLAWQIQSLKEDDAHIIVVNCWEKKLKYIMCEAYKAGMYGRGYVWMLADWLSADWPERSYSGIDCTPDQIYDVIRSSAIFFNYQTLTNNHRETHGFAGMSLPEFKKRWSDEAHLIYDSVWAIGLGLNKTVADLKGSGKGLEDFTYSDKAMGDLILKNIWGQEFLGISGEVFFDENGDVPRDVQFSRYRGTKKEVVGIYSQSKDDIRMYDETGLSWEGGVPNDATTFMTIRVFVSRTVYLSVCCCATIGMVVAAAFLVFNIYYRRLRIIKMSSPIMNNVILLGCIVVYLTVFLQELSAGNVALFCQLRTATFMVGFSLSFGALFAKTWRVYDIFMNTTKRVVLREYKLLLMVGVLVLIDLTAFVLREILDTPSVVNVVLEKEIINDGVLVVEKEILACQSDYSLYFKAFVIVYKGLLLIFGSFLAYQTRKVNIPALNDSQYIGMCVYNVTILSILGAVLVFALQNQVVLSYILTSAFIIFATMIVQLTIFIPKVLKVCNVSNHAEDDSTETEAVTNQPGTSLTTIENSAELQEMKRELEATKKQLEEGSVRQQKLQCVLQTVKKQLQEA